MAAGGHETRSWARVVLRWATSAFLLPSTDRLWNGNWNLHGNASEAISGLGGSHWAAQLRTGGVQRPDARAKKSTTKLQPNSMAAKAGEAAPKR
jgi:hypothetical protein